ncbi:hypothetical protein V6N11_052720 [Hibiscus sabdariffa]|uniref:Uncharacterized protein n=1 Tax=Hibiscus sabdariffa TaxID=183260 RepID=A0ABR2UB49_9ROSI
MELLMLVVVESIATVVLLGIQATGESAPPSSLAGNFQKAKSKGKQTLQRKHPGMAENGYNINIRGKIMIARFSMESVNIVNDVDLIVVMA